MFEVEVRNVAGEPAAVGRAGPHTLVVDRPADGGGRGVGFNGGQLLYLAIAGCVSNDLFREARAEGIALERVRVSVDGDFQGDPPVSTSARASERAHPRRAPPTSATPGMSSPSGER